MTQQELALALHAQWAGKIEIAARAPVGTREELALAYSPGVAAPCLEIQKDVDLSYKYTRRWNTVAVITDGTAVLGLGDIGPEAGMPVMEGKCLLFKSFAGIDAIPLCVRSKDVDDIVAVVRLLAGSFGGINLEDISAPRCFEIERRLKEYCDVPVFHDDQHGTAVVALAAMINAFKVTSRSWDNAGVVVLGAGAAGIAIMRLLLAFGLKRGYLCDKDGALYEGKSGMNPEQAIMSKLTNPERVKGGLADLLKGADAVIGVAAANCITGEMVSSMAKNPIVFAMSNPVPEIMPDDAKAAGAAVIGTGRSDYPNQINNVLAFPGIFRGALDARAGDITDEMKIAAAKAIAGLTDNPTADCIIPSPFDKRVVPAVAKAVAEAYGSY